MRHRLTVGVPRTGQRMTYYNLSLSGNRKTVCRTVQNKRGAVGDTYRLRYGIRASRPSSTNACNVLPVSGLISRNVFLTCIKHVPFFTYTSSIALLSERHAFRHLMREQGIRVNTQQTLHKML